MAPGGLWPWVGLAVVEYLEETRLGRFVLQGCWIVSRLIHTPIQWLDKYVAESTYRRATRAYRVSKAQKGKRRTSQL
jgi:hypothetical protein